MSSKNLTYEGCSHFRQRILLATLSGKSIRISKIRELETVPGLAAYEVDLLRLLGKLSKGASILFDTTKLTYHPGVLDGGRIQHDCDNGRGIGYYLEAILCLAPFMKEPLDLKLTGVTNSQLDVSVDAIKDSTLPVLKRFIGTDEGLSLAINKRGVAPDGGGEIQFCCPVRQKLRPVQLCQSGKVCRIRGISWTARVSPGDISRMTDSAKAVLGGCLHDMYITSDHRKGPCAGKSPGFGIVLVAYTKTGEVYSAEAISNPKGSPDGPSLPEDVGREAAIKLLLEISKGGCVDSQNQFIACTLMVLNDKDVSKLLFGPLTDYTIHYLRHLRDFFGVTFKIDAQQAGEAKGDTKFILTCVGTGYRNLSKPIL